MNRIKQFLCVREGGETKRCHTFPHKGEYTVANHSYNALSLLLLLYPGNPSTNLIKAVLWHDVPERWTGDIPAPAKWASAELKQILDDLEMRVFKKIGLSGIFCKLTKKEKQWLAAVDLLELLIWVLYQDVVISKPSQEMCMRILTLFEQKKKEIPKEVWEFKNNFQITRSPELDELLKEKKNERGK